MQMLQKIRNSKGFTLVELMIVVAIIGILAAIAIPAFLRSVKKSKTSEAEGIMRKMTDGAKGYFTSEQRFSSDAASGGDQPWHVGDPAPGLANTVGMPVPWPAYVFPGGNAFVFNTQLASPAAALATCTLAPTGGAKQLGFTGPAGQPATTDELNPVLNRLGVSFPDQYYFTYEYRAQGLAAAAQARVRALAEFKVGGECHTIKLSQ